MNVPASLLHTLWDYSDPPESERRFREQWEGAEGSDAFEYETQIARTFSLRGECAQAHTLLDGLEERLEEVSARAVTRYHLERGRTFRSDKNPAEAIPHFEDAFTHAGIADDAYLAIDAAHMLAITQGSDADLWHQRGLEMARGTEDERAQAWLGSLLNNYGWFLHDANRFDDALAIFREAEAEFEAQGHVKRLNVARYTVARCLRSMQRIDEAWDIQQSLVASNDGYVFEELGELALLKGEPAGPWFQKAVALLESDRYVEASRLERMRELSA